MLTGHVAPVTSDKKIKNGKEPSTIFDEQIAAGSIFTAMADAEKVASRETQRYEFPFDERAREAVGQTDKEKQLLDNRLSSMTREDRAAAEADGVFYSCKNPAKPDFMCRCNRVKFIKGRSGHRRRDCINARCQHVTKDGRPRLRNDCSECRPAMFCPVCISFKKPVRKNQCRCAKARNQ